MKMKIFICVFAALLCVLFCSCGEEAPKPVLPSEPESIPEESVPTEEEENLLYGYVSADEISEEAKKDKEYYDSGYSLQIVDPRKCTRFNLNNRTWNIDTRYLCTIYKCIPINTCNWISL